MVTRYGNVSPLPNNSQAKTIPGFLDEQSKTGGHQKVILPTS